MGSDGRMFPPDLATISRRIDSTSRGPVDLNCHYTLGLSRRTWPRLTTILAYDERDPTKATIDALFVNGHIVRISRKLFEELRRAREER